MVIQIQRPFINVILKSLIIYHQRDAEIEDSIDAERLIVKPDDPRADEARQRSRLNQIFNIDLYDVLEAWTHKESVFKFMEHSAVPRAVGIATLLTELLQKAETLYECVINESNPALASLKSLTSSEDELRFVECLFNQSEWSNLIGGHEHITSEMTRDRLSDSLTLIHDSLRAYTSQYVWSLLASKRDVKLNQSHSKRQQQSHSKRQQQSHSKSHSKRQQQSLSHLESHEHFKEVIRLSSNVSYDKWSDLSVDRDDILSPQFDAELRKVLKDLRAQWSDIWSGYTHISPEHQAQLALHVWDETIFDYCYDHALALFKSGVVADLTADLCIYFENLIDKERPKGQRFGSFVIDPMRPERIMLTFLTRDGGQLASRALTWNPKESTSAIKAFKEINISTLIYGCDIDTNYPDLVKVLKNNYDMYCVSSVALPVLDETDLECSLKERALYLGGRYVAPLRFWIRSNLDELIKCFIPDHLHELVEEHGEYERALNSLCTERWLSLRRKRSRSNATVHISQSPPHLLGERAQATVVWVTTRRVQVILQDSQQSGYLELDTHTLETLRATSSAGLNCLSIGSILPVYLAAEHPITHTLTFTLVDPYLKSSSQDKRRTIGSSGHSEVQTSEVTMNRLNSIFQPKN